jgi:hypothetical protein
MRGCESTVTCRDRIEFEFREVTAAAVPAAVRERRGAALVKQCYEQNVQY